MTPLHCHRIEACRQEIVPDDEGAKAWRRDAVHSVDDIARVTRAVADAMIGAGYPETEIYRVHLALEEALVNAHKHGHGGDWGKPVGVRYHVGSDGVVVQVEDEGPGFDPALVPDPLAPENLERPSGRGLLIMRTYLSGVCHNERGNTICLCKHRSGDFAPAGDWRAGRSEPAGTVRRRQRRNTRAGSRRPPAFRQPGAIRPWTVRQRNSP